MSSAIPKTVPSLALPRFKALADEKRLRIVELLAQGEHCVCDLQEAVGAGQSLLSFHLRTLREAGLVTDRREGRWIYYALDEGAFAELQAFLGELPLRRTRDRGSFRRCD